MYISSFRLRTLTAHHWNTVSKYWITTKSSKASAESKEIVSKPVKPIYTPALYAHFPLTVTKAQGPYLYATHAKPSADGKLEERKYLDFTAGIAVLALGHAHPGCTQIMYNQAKEVGHTSNLFLTEPSAQLAERLVESAKKSGFDASTVYFGNSGTEANEAAIKFARAIAKQSSSQSKDKIISFKGGFHGRTFASLSATHNPKYQKPFMPLVPGFVCAEFNKLDTVKELADDDLCAILVEPIQGEGGIYPADPIFLQGLRDICDKHNALLIFDEIQCGLGRTGSLFAHTPYDVFPDILTLAKPLANGFPIGATVMTAEVSSHLYPGLHGTTFGGNAIACAIGNYVVETISNPEFLTNVRLMGEELMRQLNKTIKTTNGFVVEVRGRGLMIGVQLADSPNDTVIRCRERGLIICTAGYNTLRILPPLIAERTHIKEAVSILRDVLEEIAREKGYGANST